MMATTPAHPALAASSAEVESKPDLRTDAQKDDDRAIADLLQRAVAVSAGISSGGDTQHIIERVTGAAIALKRLPSLGVELSILSAALSAVKHGRPELAAGMLDELEKDMRIASHPLWSIIRGKSAALPFFVGMVACVAAMPLVWFYMQSLLIFLWRRSPQHTLLDIDVGLLLFVAFAGGIGAEVSMMLRLPAYARAARQSGPLSERQTLFMAGFFRPWIGVGFAVFSYMLLRSGLIKVGGGELTPLVYLSLGFVTGFSERLGADLISRAENTLQGPGGSPPADAK